MAEALLTTVLKQTCSERELRRLISALEMFLEFKLFTKGQNEQGAKVFDEFFHGHHVAEDTQRRLRSLPESFFVFFTRDNLYGEMNSLKKAFEKLPRMLLYTPKSLPSESQEQLGLWLREHVDARVLVRFEVDPDLTVGCAFVWNEIYYDYGLRYLVRRHERDIVNTIRAYVENV